MLDRLWMRACCSRSSAATCTCACAAYCCSARHAHPAQLLRTLLRHLSAARLHLLPCATPRNMQEPPPYLKHRTCCASALYRSVLAKGSLLLRWLSVVTLNALRGLSRNLWKGWSFMPSVSTTNVNLRHERAPYVRAVKSARSCMHAVKMPAHCCDCCCWDQQ